MNAADPQNVAVRNAAIAGCVVFLVLLASGWTARSWFTDSLYREKIRAAESTLDLVAGGAVLPLVSEDGLTLNSLVKGAGAGERFLFVMVSDSANVVRAASDFRRVGFPWKESGNGVLDLSRPILFQGKPVGAVHAGVSPERLRASAGRDSFPVLWIPIAALLCAVAAGGGAFAATRLASGPGVGAASPCEIPEGVPDVIGDSGTARTPVTVLVASVMGFRSFADATLPDELMRNLKEIFSIASRIVLGYGGHVEKYQGESLTGVFGAPADLADHTRRAIRAAVSIQKALQEAAENGNALLAKVSIGVSTGVVLSGRIPSGETSSPFYVGEIFEEAASLNRAAREGEIVISRDVYQSVQSLVVVEPLPPHGTGGGRGSWEAFRLLRIEERKHRA